MDQSKKTMRHFYCRDALWEVFEQMAKDFDCSVDYLVNESMRYYARSKNYRSQGRVDKVSKAKGSSSSLPSRKEEARKEDARKVASVAQPVPAAQSVAADSGALAGANATLFLLYNGERYPVAKDQFIIGRGSKSSDLAIKDGNISRKHAAVIRRNGTFYIKDLGSTNGIDYNGMRIDNKRIDEGDVFHLCEYELRFTYRS